MTFHVETLRHIDGSWKTVSETTIVVSNPNADPVDVLDTYDFGHVESTHCYGYDTAERIWNRAYDDYGTDRWSIIAKIV